MPVGKKVIAALLALPIAVCLVVAAWPQGFGLEQAPVIAQVVAPRVGVIGIALGLLVLAALAALIRPIRRFALLVMAMLTAFILVSGGIHISRGLGSTGLVPEDGNITILSWNTLGSAPSADVLAELINETGADVVTLPETFGESAEAAAALLDTEFQVFTVANPPAYGALNTSLMISAGLGEYELAEGPHQTLPTVVARPSDGDGPTILATHPVAPGRGQMRLWRAELRELADLCDAEPSLIIAGDLNSTLDHWANLGEGDFGSCTDAARAAGATATGSWPTSLPAWLGTQIDHVVVSDDWQVVDFHVVTDRDDAGSDHRPVVATLRAR